MHKIVEVDVIGDFSLRLTYDDGLVCDINLYQYASSPVFSDVSLFIKFGLLPDGALEWLPDIKISASELRKRGVCQPHAGGARKALRRCHLARLL